MFFTQENKYTNSEIDQSIKEKGFSVYNYISLKELFMTVQRDYLGILSVINLPFGIITIVLGVISYASGSAGLLFSVLGLAYGIIFMILLFKLVLRSFYFLYVSNVIYTKKGIILGNKLYLYSDTKNLDEKLGEYEQMFDEFLSKPSKLEQIILKKKSDVLRSTSDAGKKVLDIAGNFRSEDSAKLIIPIFLSYGLYVGLLYVFYYLGYFFGLAMFYSVYLVLKAIYRFKENTEIKMKQRMEEIGAGFDKMEKIDEVLTSKITTFKDGEISKIAKSVESQFSNFYGEVLLVLKERTELLKIIKKSKYKDFIDFETLEKYLKNRFNKPVKEMLSLLSQTESMLNTGLNELKALQTNALEGQAAFKQKELVLQHQLDVLTLNKSKLEASLMQ